MWDHQTVTVNRKWCMGQAITEELVARRLCDRLMFEIKKVFQTAIIT